MTGVKSKVSTLRESPIPCKALGARARNQAARLYWRVISPEDLTA